MRNDLIEIEFAEKIRDIGSLHAKYMKSSISLIASDNLLSPLARELLISDFGSRYGEGHPGNTFTNEVESITNDLGQRLFKTKLLNTRPISGTNANQAVLFALSKPGQTVAALSELNGGHASSTTDGAVGMRGLETIELPYDIDEMNIDVDGAIKLIRTSKPHLVLLGQSVFLFPIPLKELGDALQEAGSWVWYDGAHVMGLIAGNIFQDPLSEGADFVTGSTHKTFPGPQRGLILGGKRLEEKWESINSAVFPGVLANYHLNTLASLGITFAEELKFGQSYAQQIVKNAFKLGNTLHDLGAKILGEKNGFTKSHTLLIDVGKYGGGISAASRLERAMIFVNPYVLPYDQTLNMEKAGGIRLGVQEMTRIGMKESEMVEIADLIVKVLEGKSPLEEIKNRVREVKTKFHEVEYCFDRDVDAYDYIRLSS